MNTELKNSGGSVQVVRVKKRIYSDGRIVSHSEYAVIDATGKQGVIARLVFNRRSWIAIRPTGEHCFGKPVSPLNLTRLRDVKQWVLESLCQPK